MAQTHDLGPFFVHTVSLRRGTPRVHRSPTQELDAPYRSSNSLVLRIWGEFGLVFGRWRRTDFTEEEAIFAATGGRETDIEPLIKQWEEADQ